MTHPDETTLEVIRALTKFQKQLRHEALQDQSENPTWHEEPTTEEKWAMWDYYENQIQDHNEI